MEILIDTCDADALKKLAYINAVDGVTTNPSILAKAGDNLESAFRSISKIIKGTIHLQVTEKTVDGMIAQGKKLSQLSKNVVVKIPMSEDGLHVCNEFSKMNIKTNVTLCFSPIQALMASRAGASYVSLFIGRLDDIGSDSMEIVEDCCRIWQNYPTIQSKLLIASIRNVLQVTKLAAMGVDAVTIPPQIALEMSKHSLTDAGLKKFDQDYQNMLKKQK